MRSRRNPNYIKTSWRDTYASFTGMNITVSAEFETKIKAVSKNDCETKVHESSLP